MQMFPSHYCNSIRHECTQLHLGLHWGADTVALLLCKHGLPFVWAVPYFKGFSITVRMWNSFAISRIYLYLIEIYIKQMTINRWKYSLVLTFHHKRSGVRSDSVQLTMSNFIEIWWKYFQAVNQCKLNWVYKVSALPTLERRHKG